VRRKTILLTGAAGKVGRLVRPLLRETHALRLCDVAAIDDVVPGEEFVQGDLADPVFARSVVAGVDGVVHLAGLVAVDVSFEETLAPNYRAVLALLEACRAEKVGRFVFASTHHVLGLHPLGPVAPDAALAPDGFYSLAKVFGEAACAMYAHRFGLACLAIRIGFVGTGVADGRRERLWISPRDLVQLIQLGLARTEAGSTIVYGLSDCPDPFFDNAAAQALGYRPLDRPSDFREEDFVPLAAIQPPETITHVGGRFAAQPLPDPFRYSSPRFTP
jgi:uronate dehydrogenase